MKTITTILCAAAIPQLASALEIGKSTKIQPEVKVEKAEDAAKANENAVQEDPAKAKAAAKPKAMYMPEVGKTPWLGISGSPIGETLAEQLGIENGLALKHVSPKGPAKDILKKNQILTHLGDQEIGSVTGLKKALKDKKVGEEVELTLLEKGKEIKKKVKLGARPKGMAMGFNDRFPGFKMKLNGKDIEGMDGIELLGDLEIFENLDGLGGLEGMENFEEMFEGMGLKGAKPLVIPLDGWGKGGKGFKGMKDLKRMLDPEMFEGLGLPEGQMEKLMEQLENVIPQGDMDDLDDLKGKMDLKIEGFELKGEDLKGIKMFRGGAAGMSTLRDNKGSITLKRGPKGSTLKAEDNEGNLLYEGPAETDDDKAAIPEDIMQRAKGLFPKKKM